MPAEPRRVGDVGVPFERILVPVDSSALAEAMIPYALGIARTMGIKLTVLQVIADESEMADADRYVQALAGRLEAEGRVAIAQNGNVAGSILDESTRDPRALIAMTTHGRGALLDAVFGSVAMGVARAADAVLVYHPLQPERSAELDSPQKITTVVAPVDGSDVAHLHALPHAVEMAQSLGASLVLIQVHAPAGVLGTARFAWSYNQPHVVRQVLGPEGKLGTAGYWEPPDVVEAYAEDIKKKFGIEVECEVLSGNPADAITSYVRERRDAMLVMSSHTRVGVSRMVLGSVTADSARRAGVPVLIHRCEGCEAFFDKLRSIWG